MPVGFQIGITRLWIQRSKRGVISTTYHSSFVINLFPPPVLTYPTSVDIHISHLQSLNFLTCNSHVCNKCVSMKILGSQVMMPIHFFQPNLLWGSWNLRVVGGRLWSFQLLISKKRKENEAVFEICPSHQHENVDADLGLSPNFISSDFFLLDFKHMNYQTINKKRTWKIKMSYIPLENCFQSLNLIASWRNTQFYQSILKLLNVVFLKKSINILKYVWYALFKKFSSPFIFISKLKMWWSR